MEGPGVGAGVGGGRRGLGVRALPAERETDSLLQGAHWEPSGCQAARAASRGWAETALSFTELTFEWETVKYSHRYQDTKQ